MVCYNIYKGRTKINSRPISKDSLQKLLKEGVFVKQINELQYEQYSMRDLKVIECIVV